VNATLSTAGCAESAAPMSPNPVSTLTTPSGTPASAMTSASNSAVSGVCSAGLRITVLPHASAGATLNAAITSGKFHGMICAHTPTGSRSVKAWNRPPGAHGTDTGMVRPSILVAQPA
jgi:hypothetical protein